MSVCACRPGGGRTTGTSQKPQQVTISRLSSAPPDESPGVVDDGVELVNLIPTVASPGPRPDQRQPELVGTAS